MFKSCGSLCCRRRQSKDVYTSYLWSARVNITMAFMFSQRSESSLSVTTNVSQNSKTGPYLEGNLKLIDTLECTNDVMCCKFNADGSALAVGQIDGVIKIFNPNNSQLLYSLQDDDTLKHHLPVTQIRFRIFSSLEKEEYSHILVASYASGHVKFWHYTSGKCLHTINEVRTTLNVALNPEGTKFITTGDTTEINIYDEETKKKLNTLEPSDNRNKMDGHHFRVFAAIYHPEIPHVFLTGGWDNTVHYWDDRQPHSIRYLHGPHICGDALDIDPYNNHILTGSWRKKDVLQIWDFSSAEKIKDVPPDPMGHTQLYCCQWLGRDSILCGGSDLNLAKVVDRGTLSTIGQVTDLSQGVYCCDHDNNSSRPLMAIGSLKQIFLIKPEKRV